MPASFDSADPTLAARSEHYLQLLRERFEYWVDFIYPEVAGHRIPLLHVRTDDATTWYRLEEIFRKWRLWKNGMFDGDEETERFEKNEDNAQQHLLELRVKFLSEE